MTDDGRLRPASRLAAGRSSGAARRPPGAASRPAVRGVRRSAFGPLDEAVWWLDSPEEPWSVHLEVRVQGRLDDARLREAVLVAMDRHPRSWARLVASGRRRHRWEIPRTPDVDHFDVVSCPDTMTLAVARAQLEDEPIPLTTSPPLRVRLAHHPAGDVIILNLHHVAADGLSGLALLRSIALAYAGRADPERDDGPERVSLARGAKALAPGFVELARAARPSVHLVPDGGDGRPGYGFHHLVLSATDTASLVQRSRRAGVTVNDMLLTALHLTVERWNAAHGEPGGRISVLMPVNLRPKGEADHVVGNFSLTVPVTTGPTDRVAPAAALHAVARRTTRFKAGGTPVAVVRLLRLLQHLPPRAKDAVAKLVVAPKLAPTTLLSNLGRVDERLDFGPDGGTATELWFTPPVKLPVGLAVGVVTACDQLHLGFRYRHPLFGPVQMAEFSRRYVSDLGGLGVAEAPTTGRWKQVA